MVRNYKRVSGRKRWSQVNLSAAIEAVQSHGASVNRAAIDHAIPRQTLRRYLRMSQEELSCQNLGRYKTVFNEQQEKELVDHILSMEKRFYGVTPRDVRSLAYQLAEQNKINHQFNRRSNLAGLDWLYGFRRRHPELALRSPEATSAVRAQAFNKPAVNDFFDKLEEVLEVGNFSPSQIYNVDETSVLTVQTKRSKILALKGRRQVGCISLAERGLLSTACLCMSATGHFVPPMILFPRMRMTEQLKKGAPPDTIFSCNASGWMTTDDFNVWFDHFLKFTNPTAARPLLLLLDGHVSHTKNLAFLEKARRSNVTVMSLPPHCSHKLQPLDISFMGPFKTHFSKAIEAYLKGNPGKVVSINEISTLLGHAFMKTATVSVASNGFRKAGIAPYNRYIFNDNDFAPADVTDVPVSVSAADENRSLDELDDDMRCPVDLESNNKCASSQKDDPMEGCSSAIKKQKPKAPFDVSPEMILPLPKTQGRKTTTARQKPKQKQKATELTSSSYREVLKASQANKDIQQVNRTKKRLSKPNTETPKKRNCGRNKRNQENIYDSLCDACGCCFTKSNSGEGWTKCITCVTWFHQCRGDHCPECGTS